MPRVRKFIQTKNENSKYLKTNYSRITVDGCLDVSDMPYDNLQVTMYYCSSVQWLHHWCFTHYNYNAVLMCCLKVKAKLLLTMTLLLDQDLKDVLEVSVSNWLIAYMYQWKKGDKHIWQICLSPFFHWYII